MSNDPLNDLRELAKAISHPGMREALLAVADAWETQVLDLKQKAEHWERGYRDLKDVAIGAIRSMPNGDGKDVR